MAAHMPPRPGRPSLCSLCECACNTRIEVAAVSVCCVLSVYADTPSIMQCSRAAAMCTHVAMPLEALGHLGTKYLKSPEALGPA